MSRSPAAKNAPARGTLRGRAEADEAGATVPPMAVVRTPGWDRGPAPRVSVVVATCGRSGMLRTLLDALEAQTFDRAQFEVVVVDDASPDDTWSVLTDAAATSPLRLVGLRLGANSGAGAARTAGVGQARGSVVAFTDDDCVPVADWLEHLTAPLLDSGETDPPPMVVQGRTEPWPEDAEAGGPWARTVWVLRPTWLFETCNIAYRRADLVEAGGFPGWQEAPASPTGRPTGEDALLGWRVVEAGSRLLFEPDALVHHRNFPATYRQWLAEQRGRAVFPALVARSPLARRAFWAGWFLAPRSAATVVAVAGVVLGCGRRRTRYLVAVVPWVALALPEARARQGRPVAVRLVQLAVVDLVGLAATARASAEHRALVL